MKSIIIYLILFLSFFNQNAEDIARRTEQKLRSLNSFVAEFRQIYHSSSVSAPLKESGKVYYKKPGLMKWTYTEPEEKIILLKENKIQYFFIEDNQLLIQEATEEEQGLNIMSLLSGSSNIFQNYLIENNEDKSPEKNSYHIKLIPKNESTENFILLNIDKRTLFITKATFFDWAGNKQEFEFSGVKTNIDLPDQTFSLDLPNDVEIIK